MKQPLNNTLGISRNNSFLFSTENKALESIGLISAIIALIILGFFTSFKVNSLSPVEINFYPNYLYVNYYHLVNTIIISGFATTIYCLKHAKLRQFIMKELKMFISKFRKKLYSLQRQKSEMKNSHVSSTFVTNIK
jgi:hypothetical protein